MSGRLIAMISGGLLLLPLALTTPARADAIDGTWCSPDKQHMVIDGSRIDTPGGNRISGNYDRHGFSYIVPDNEPQAGSTVTMDLIDEDTIHLRYGHIAQNNRIEIWTRCELTT